MIGHSQRHALNGPLSDTISKLTVGQLESKAPTIVASGMDQFIRETQGGKQVLQRISLYAMLPYAAAGFIIGYLVARK